MPDAVFIGSGHNNLVAAIILAKAGWKVSVFEREPEVGGAIGTIADAVPGFRFDRMGSSHTLIFLAPFWPEWEDDLARHGLEYLSYPISIASVFPKKKPVCLYPKLEDTLDSLARLSAADAEGWKKLYGIYQDTRDVFTGLLSSPLPSLHSVESMAGPRLRLGPRGNMEFIQMLTLPGRVFASNYFTSDEAKAWLMPWALHLTHSPESAGGGVFSWLVSAATQDPKVGIRVPRGGAGGLTEALAGYLKEVGGVVHTKSPVAKVIVKRNTARGVVLADGTKVEAGRAVIAGTSPTALYFDLIGEDRLPSEFVSLARRYRYGLPVVKVDYALSKPVPWLAGEEPGKAGLVHVSASVDAMSEAYNQALRGCLPAEPLLVLTQPTVADPSRAPDGGHVLWAIARVPYEVRGDAAGKFSPQPWGKLKDRFADRMSDIIERHAPGFKGSIKGRVVMSPEDLQARNPNLVHGDIGTGSVAFHQSYVFRPLPGWSRYQTPVRQLYLCSAGAHPGPGIHGLVGYTLGKMLA